MPSDSSVQSFVHTSPGAKGGDGGDGGGGDGGDGGGGAGGGGGGDGELHQYGGDEGGGGWTLRGPQSAQSVPIEQPSSAAPGPPSSQLPS